MLITLGDFEYLVLTATARLGTRLMGAAIRVHIEDCTKRTCSVGALYTALDRWEEKGLIETWMGKLRLNLVTRKADGSPHAGRF